MSLDGKTVLITGAALRIGRSLALAVAQAGGNVVLHYGKSRKDAESLQAEIEATGRKAFILQADLVDSAQAAALIDRAREHSPLFALVNNASVFEPHGWADTSLELWNRSLAVGQAQERRSKQTSGRFMRLAISAAYSRAWLKATRRFQRHQ